MRVMQTMRADFFWIGFLCILGVCLGALSDLDADKQILTVPSEQAFDAAGGPQESASESFLDGSDIGLSKRDENVVLTEFLTTLNESGQGVELAETLCTSPLTQSSVSDTIVEYLRQQNLTEFLVAADNSNLGLDITLLFLRDYNAFSGLITVLRNVRSGDSSGSQGNGSSSNTSSPLGAIGGALDITNQAIIRRLVTFFRQTDDFESSMISLDKSGLAVSVLADSVTDSDFRDFVINLLTEVRNDRIFTFLEVLGALRASGILRNTALTILTTSEYRILLIRFVIYLLRNWRNIL